MLWLDFANRIRFLWLPIVLVILFLVSSYVVAPFISSLFPEDYLATSFFIPTLLLFMIGFCLTIVAASPLVGMNRARRLTVMSLSLSISILSLLAGFLYNSLFSLAISSPEVMPLIEIVFLLGSIYCWIVGVGLFFYINYWICISDDEHIIYQNVRISQVDYFRSELLPLLDPPSAAIAISFVREADRMRRIAFIALYGVAVLVVLAVLAVVFAGRLTEADQRATSVLDQAQEWELRSQRNLDELIKEAAVLSRRINSVGGAFEGSPDAKGSKEFIDDLIDSKARLEELPSRIQIARDQYSSAVMLTNSVKQSLIESGIGSADSTNVNALVASAVTRFGLVIVLTFFAQALINLYRYAIRLSSFYWSRAMLVAMASGDDARQVALAEVISPLRVSLGREPSSIVDEAVKLLKAARGSQQA